MHTSNLIAYAAPIFTLMIMCEFLYGYFKNKNNYRLNDTFTSISLGMISRFPLIFVWEFRAGICLDLPKF